MAEQSQVKSVEQTNATETKRWKRNGIWRNPAMQLKAATLRGAGYTVENIAKELGVSYVTAFKMVKESGADDVLKLAVKTIRSSIPQIAKMTTREIIEKKDRRLGFEVLKESGVIADAGPQRDKVESGRITFEFNFPPPPWAPRPVIEASQPSQPKLLDARPSDGDGNVQDAEIVQDGTSDEAESDANDTSHV